MSDKQTLVFGTLAADSYLALGVQGDTVERFSVGQDGKLEWGAGSAAALDVALERTAAGILKITTGSFSGGAPVVLATSTTITEALHAGKVLLLTGTGAAFTQTLPAATGTGARFLFVVGAVNTSNHLVKVANATDVMFGNIITNSTDDTPDLGQPWPTASTSDTITLNGTTTGGVAVGDYVEVIDIAAGKFMVRGVTTTSGTEATPFSAAVS